MRSTKALAACLQTIRHRFDGGYSISVWLTERRAELGDDSPIGTCAQHSAHSCLSATVCACRVEHSQTTPPSQRCDTLDFVVIRLPG